MLKITIKKFRTFLEYVIIIFTLLDGTTMWKYLENGPVVGRGVNPQITKYVILLVVLIYLIIDLIERPKISRKLLLYMLAFCIYNFSYIIIKSVNAIEFFNTYMLVLFVLGIFIYCLKRNNRLIDFLKKFANVIYILAFASLFFYVFGTILHIIPEKFVSVKRITSGVNVTYSVPTYFHLMYNGQTQNIFGLRLYRNTGIYLEAPGWIFTICCALFIEIFIKENTNKRRIIIFILTGITTFSTKGLIFIPCLIFLKSFKNRKSNSATTVDLIKKYFGILLFIVLIFLFQQILENKILNNSDSYYSRMEDYTASILVWKDYPLFGIGYNVLDEFEKYLSFQAGSTITCGFLKLLAQCGVYIGIEYYGALINLIVKSNKDDKYRNICAVIMIIFFLLFSSTWYNMIFLFVVACGLLSGFKFTEEENIVEQEMEVL